LTRGRARLPLALLSTLLTFCCGGSPTDPSSFPISCEYESAISPSHCGCGVGLPFDSAIPGSVDMWPFGVHAQSGHIEGHRGVDVTTTTAVVVTSPVDGTVASIDNAQDSSGTLVLEFGTQPRFTTITADCGLRIKFIPLVLDAGIVAGTRVTRGQRLGTLAEFTPAFHGPGLWSTHFEIDARPPSSDPALYAVCPSQLMSSTDAGTLTTMLNGAQYSERFARTVDISCENGSRLNMNFPAEDLLCNPRLDAASRSRLAGCIPSRASTIW
jgi:hypothetical protein